MPDWQAIIKALNDAGYSDQDISTMCGVTRAIINRVRNGIYKFKFDPGYVGGTVLLKMLDKAVAAGAVKDPRR